jgi:hypothetical protein
MICPYCHRDTSAAPKPRPKFRYSLQHRAEGTFSGVAEEVETLDDVVEFLVKAEARAEATGEPFCKYFRVKSKSILLQVSTQEI